MIRIVRTRIGLHKRLHNTITRELSEDNKDNRYTGEWDIASGGYDEIWRWRRNKCSPEFKNDLSGFIFKGTFYYRLLTYEMMLW